MQMFKRATAVLVVVASTLVVAACGDSESETAEPAAQTAQQSTASAPTPDAEAAQPSVAEAAEAEPGSGKGIKIGYMSSKESVPVVRTISDGIKAQAERAGVDLLFCDTNGDNAKALDCAKTFKTQGAQGILNFQQDAAASPSICKAGPDVPVFAVDIPQKPCQTSFMGVDNSYGGQIAGRELGRHFKENFDCEYDAFLSLENPAIGQPNEDRMGGYREGFAEFCGEVQNLKKVGFDASAEQARTKITDTLTTMPSAKRIVITALNDEGIVGAFAAAKAAGREKQLYAASLGMADDSVRCGLKENPNWVTATAIFPEKYGWIGIPYMIKAAKGEKVDPNLFVPLKAVTGSTIDEFYDLSC